MLFSQDEYKRYIEKEAVLVRAQKLSRDGTEWEATEDRGYYAEEGRPPLLIEP